MTAYTLPKLTEFQEYVLSEIRKYQAVPYDFANIRTLRKLESLKLIRWYPYSKTLKGGAWKPC